MKKHLLCLTVDTDPDGLSGKTTNRQTLRWDGLEQLKHLPDELNARSELGSVPVTWFIRADGQLESILGRSEYLLERHHEFWQAMSKRGHELAWHPHLYMQARAEDAAVLITDPQEARDELERVWDQIRTDFHAKAFRNGEGWHSAETFSTVERFGFECDSTAIPGRRGAVGHPMNWDGAPNQPYFPASDDVCKAGPRRALLEIPMNTWLVNAPHDPSPRTRYMNPAVHPHIFENSLKNWENACKAMQAELSIWVMIFHPDEVLSTAGADGLYARSLSSLCQNLASFARSVKNLGHDFAWSTVSDAATRWREHQEGLTA